MTAIRIRELSAEPDGCFRVRVDFGAGGGADVRVSDPVDEAQEKLLAWYFEEHLRYPFLDKDLEARTAGQIGEYGRALFEQVFTGEAAFGYRRVRDRGFDGCRLVVEGSARFHRLHWEALADPDGGGVLALRMPVVRRVDRTPLVFEVPDDRPVINILVVTARPKGALDVGYRTVSRPLLDALRQARVPVMVEVVRPGTWEALRDRLREASREHGTGWYQVVHFDVHGGFGTAQALAAGVTTGRYLFDPDQGATEGEQGFLFFETGVAGQARPVPSVQVARLLAEHRVGVAVLNACQSAMQTGSEASLAQDLVAAGAPVAVGMAYSVTVSAAVRAMPVFYGRLAAGDDPVTAAWVMRQALHDDKARRGYFDQDLDLEDWMLPVVFGQRELSLQLRPMSTAERDEFYRRGAEVVAEPAVEYGFVGRDLDIHALERRLLLDSKANQVLVRGMAGAGKSTLLAHVGWWWQRTGLVQRVFSFSFEQRAWTAGQIVRHVAQALLGTVGFAEWDSLSTPGAKVEQIAGLLSATRYLLVIDNAESITASPAAIPHALSRVERDRLADLLARLRGGRSLVLIGSREAESWLAPSAFAGNVYELPGLDAQAASALAERILTRHGGARYLTEQADVGQRKALEELLTLLGGYPLPMTVVLPQVATTAPGRVLAELRAGGEQADPVGAVRRAIEYSHGKLDPAVQRSMLLLAPFTATIPTVALDVYTRELGEQEAARALGEVDIAAAVGELTRVGLAAEHPVLAGWAQILPVLPYFLRNRLVDQPVLRDAVGQAHYRLYTQLGAELEGLLTGNEPWQRAVGQAATSAEYANLTTALDHGLATGQPILAIVRALYLYLDQAQQHDARRQLLAHAIVSYQHAETPDQQREIGALHNLAGATALAQRRFADAQHHYETELAVKQALGRRQTEAVTYHQLGRVAQDQRRFEQAEQYYRQALDISLEFGDRHGAARTYHQLGVVAQEQRRFEQAEQYYRQALDIKLEFGDRHGAAGTYHQLGMVAQEQRRFEQAEQYYRQALDISLEFGDRHGAAGTYHQLGWVAQDQRRFEQAEQYYRQALDIFLEFGDRHGAARTYHHLGVVAQEQRRFEQAEQYYRQALDISLEFGDRHGAASTYHQLGRVAQDQRRFEQAEQYYRQALDILLEFGDRHGAASTYHQLGVVAQEQRRFEQAEQYYRQALDILLEFGDRHGAASTCHQLGTVLSDLAQHADAVRALLQAAVYWRSETAVWPEETLNALRQQRMHLTPDDYQHAITETVPTEVRSSLTEAIDQTEDQ